MIFLIPFRFYTFVPTAILVGVGAAPMWAALQTYLTQLAEVQSVILGKTVDVTVTKFFGLFFFFWQTCDLWGNLLSSLILTSPPASDEDPNYEMCGADFCLADYDDEAVERPADREIYILSAVYLSMILITLLMIAFLLDPLKRYGEDCTKGKHKEFIFATFRQMKEPKQQLLIGATMFIGMEQAFMAADYSAAFVSCTLSIKWIGYILLTFGLSAAIFSPIFGSAMQFTGRMPIVLLGAVAHFSIFFYSIFWEPHSDDKIKYFIIAAIFGMGDAAWQTHINGKIFDF